MQNPLNKMFISYFIFTIAFAAVMVTFVTSTTYTQLAIAIVFYLFLAFAAHRMLSKKIWSRSPKEPITANDSPIKPLENETTPLERKDLTSIGVADIDKRVFLTLIGSTGLFLLLFSLFNKRTESLLFKTLPRSNGPANTDNNSKTIDLSRNQPTDEYRISEIDDDVVSFYGFLKNDESWYIMKIDTNSGSFRYVKGERDFPSNWENRKNLKYDYFNNVFNS
ncbi:MAG: hypothetical protein A2687_00075 [Candidatus Levybacteria bacterium RIFCSPHIGHO2_01_FULL_38_26]|nr:MAG: hypothetical protein A2687_00075 [Candidatus Levybacteria bacterium RIFCSPHIGHO2_01_FULL_38_26]